jgi:hypothetical protein
MFESENEDREQDRRKATGHMLAIATLGIAGSEIWIGSRHLGVSVTGLPRDKDQGTGSGNEGNGVWERGERGLGTRRTGLGTRITGSGNEEDGAGDEDNGVRERGERGLRTRCVTSR